MPTIPTSAFSALPDVSATTTGGVTRIDLAFDVAMSKGSGNIIITDGVIQTVIDRSGETKLRVVGATFTKEIPLSQVSISGTHVKFDAAGLPPGGEYSIYMAPGTLSSGGRPYAGLTVPDQASFETPSADVPALTATIAGSGNILKAGADIELTVTFNQAVHELDRDAFSAQHASVASVLPTEDARVWKVVLTASDSVASASNVLRLDLAQVETAAGTHGSGTALSPAYAVDTVVDTYITDAIVGSDLGPDAWDGITSSPSTYMSGELAGPLDSGERIEITINGQAVKAGTVQVKLVGDTWTWDYNRERVPGEAPQFIANEDNTVVIRVVGADNHTSAEYSTTVTYDATAPVMTSSSDGAADVAIDADIAFHFSEAVYWRAEESDADVLYLDCVSDDTVRKIYLSVENFSDGGRTLTLSASQLELLAGKDYAIRLPDNLTDIGGNPLADSTIEFSTAGDDMDGPKATHATVDRTGSFGIGEKLVFRIYFDEDVRIVEAIPKIGLTGGLEATYSGGSGNSLTFSYTVKAGDNASSLEIVDIDELLGTVQDMSENLLDSAYIEFDLYDTDGYGAEVDIDTTAPNAPTLDAGGVSMTTDTTPTLAGSGEAHATIEIYEGSTKLGYTTADTNGHWSITLGGSEGLAIDQHNLTVKQVDHAGNIGAAASHTLTILPPVAPPPSAPTGLRLANDTGSWNNDRITRDSTLTGNAVAPNSQVKIYESGVLVGSGTADSAGNWTALFGTTPSDGAHTVTVRQVSASGVPSTDSSTLDFTMDRSAPAKPGAPQLAASSDTGAFNDDGITNDTTPTFTGSGLESGAVVALYMNGAEIARTNANAAGNWSHTLTESLANGNYTFQVVQYDVAGNASPISSGRAVTIDTVDPMLTAFNINSTTKQFQLSFSEPIVFRPEGEFKLMRNDSERQVFKGEDPSNWHIVTNAGGKQVLVLDVAMTGNLTLSMENQDGVQDLAGNAAEIVGAPAWLVNIFI